MSRATRQGTASSKHFGPSPAVAAWEGHAGEQDPSSSKTAGQLTGSLQAAVDQDVCIHLLGHSQHPSSRCWQLAAGSCTHQQQPCWHLLAGQPCCLQKTHTRSHLCFVLQATAYLTSQPCHQSEQPGGQKTSERHLAWWLTACRCALTRLAWPAGCISMVSTQHAALQCPAQQASPCVTGRLVISQLHNDVVAYSQPVLTQSRMLAQTWLRILFVPCDCTSAFMTWISHCSQGVGPAACQRLCCLPVFLQGNVFVNQYLIIKQLGRGAHGSVKLVFDTEQQLVHAMKVRAPCAGACCVATASSSSKYMSQARLVSQRNACHAWHAHN